MSDMRIRYSALSEPATADATTVGVADHEVFESGDVIHISATGENMLVKGTSPGVLRVVRGVGTEPHPLREGDEVLVIGSTLQTPAA